MEEEYDLSQDGEFLNTDMSISLKCKACLNSAIKDAIPLPAGCILQVQSVRNISVPRRNQEDCRIQYDPRSDMLKFTVSDGYTTGLALLIDGHPELDDNTTPGTKIRLMKPVMYISGILPLTRNTVEYLGGYVMDLVIKWKLQKTLELSRAWGYEDVTPIGGEGPPPWRPFGHGANITNKKELITFKAMEAIKDSKGGTQGDDSTQSQFEASRQEAIADLVKKSDSRKLFAEGKQLLNKDIIAITNEGFSEEIARMTLKRYKNNRAAALKFLVERRDGTRPERRKPALFKSKYGDDNSESEAEVDPSHQPSKEITLFGFIKPVIPKEDPPKRDEFTNLFDLKFEGLKLNPPNKYEQEERGSEISRHPRGRGFQSGGRRGGGRGGSGGRQDEQTRQFLNQRPTADTVEKEVYEPYRGRATDFPAMGEKELPKSQYPRNNGNASSIQQLQPQSHTNFRPAYRPHGEVDLYEQYGTERVDKQSRRNYKSFDQMERERLYRESVNQGKPISQSFTGHETYTRTFVSSQYQQQPATHHQSTKSYTPAYPSGLGSSMNPSHYGDTSTLPWPLFQPQMQQESRSPFSNSTAYVQPQRSNPNSTAYVQPQRSNPNSTAYVQPQRSNPNSTAYVQPQRSNPNSTAYVQPQRSNPNSTAYVQPQRSNPNSTAYVQPQRSNPNSTAYVQPQRSNPNSTAYVQPQRSNPPNDFYSAPSYGNNNARIDRDSWNPRQPRPSWNPESNGIPAQSRFGWPDTEGQCSSEGYRNPNERYYRVPENQSDYSASAQSYNRRNNY